MRMIPSDDESSTIELQGKYPNELEQALRHFLAIRLNGSQYDLHRGPDSGKHAPTSLLSISAQKKESSQHAKAVTFDGTLSDAQALIHWVS